jgi:hypothetical protein
MQFEFYNENCNRQGKPKYSENTSPQFYIFHNKYHMTSLWSNPCRRGDKLETNRLSCGMADACVFRSVLSINSDSFAKQR